MLTSDEVNKAHMMHKRQQIDISMILMVHTKQVLISNIQSVYPDFLMSNDDGTVSFDFGGNFWNITSHHTSHALSDGIISGDIKQIPDCQN